MIPFIINIVVTILLKSFKSSIIKHFSSNIILNGILFIGIIIGCNKLGFIFKFNWQTFIILILVILHQSLYKESQKTSSSKSNHRLIYSLGFLAVTLYEKKLNLRIFLNFLLIYINLISTKEKQFKPSLIMDFIKVSFEHKDSRKLAIFFLINLSFMFIELTYGYLSNSLGLITDSFHMLFDCLGLFIGLCASYISTLPANKEYTYGYGKVITLSGFFNGLLLIFTAFNVF